jgi:DUF1009 family protein
MTGMPVRADGPLGILCGGGSLPFEVAEAALARGRRVVLFAFRGWADPARVARYPHHWIGLAQAGRLFRLARAEGCRDLVLIGALVRPALWQLRPDWGALALLPRVVGLWRGGDNRLLAGLGAILEERGFRLLGAHEVAPDVLLPAGALGRHRPAPDDLHDIAFGLRLLAATAPFDIGQAVVVADRRVLAVEAAEGTDAMLERVAGLRRDGRIVLGARAGVLVKAPKRGQELRIDLPSIGPRTVERAAAAGLAGIAVAAGAAIAAERAQIAALADAAGLFVIGTELPEDWR